MQAAAMDPAEEPPSILWGLDPVFSAFARLFVRDILQMTESIQIPGIYFYNFHPIYKVDVLGTVVYKRERDDFFCYGVDDGTGVINCLCWKSKLLKEEEDPNKWTKHSDADFGGFNPVAELRKLREAQQRRCRLDIGELIRVRGPVKTSRQQREIMASTFYKVDDPVMAVQIAWMMEVPQLYRQFYDKRFELNAAGYRNPPFNADNLPVRSLNKIQKEAVAGPSGCQRLSQLLKEVLQVLQNEGVVYRKVKSQDEVYTVTTQDKDLLIAVKDVIREDSKREKYAEKGCHVLHILSAVRQRYSLNLSKAALELVLKTLECDSDIVSTSDSHYVAF
ncbi:PREDICTED: CST complex subunit STN1 [Cyprinodon variegatus]|uniref:CST complex subunit STN1 n=1 Tax=Cyprinodon variegatus TaxID=28743 RepID=UPI000742517C|nr:PREDICTED: CST complex subunit STN1 [Cyprinodon variegatus]